MLSGHGGAWQNRREMVRQRERHQVPPVKQRKKVRCLMDEEMKGRGAPATEDKELVPGSKKQQTGKSTQIQWIRWSRHVQLHASKSERVMSSSSGRWRATGMARRASLAPVELSRPLAAAQAPV